MKKINEMSVKELREVAKELNIAGRWDMTKAQLVEAIEKIENEKKAAKQVKKESNKEKAMRIQRAFVEVGDTRKEAYRYITITVKNAEESKAADYIDAVCAKMQEMDEEFEAEYTALRCPDYDELYNKILSVKGVGPALCERILDKLYEEYDGYIINDSQDNPE